MHKRISTDDFDLAYRPASYFWPLGLETHLLATIKGTERKAALQRLIADGRASDIPDFLAKSALSPSERKALGRIHPAFMGGEYLPDLEQTEVEIARIVIASTTWDVTSVFARRDRDCIRYRVVDEYNGETLSGDATLTSALPLTLGELESFFMNAWPLFDVLEANFSNDGFDLDRMLAFVAHVESAFYPGIGALFWYRIEAWAEERRSEYERTDEG